MRFIRYETGTDPVCYGWINDDLVGSMEGSLLGEYRRHAATIPIERVKLRAPIEPGKIICLGRNYRDHAREMGAEMQETPLIFLKPPSSIIGAGEVILLPPQSQRVEHEAELAVVIGKRGRWIHAEKAHDHILGYTIANDVTARDLQRSDGQWTRGKGFDTFCPLGPWIETDVDPVDTLITCRVNGELRQMASTQEMEFPVSQLIVFISSVMTLNPGDVILTGTPAGVGPLVNGDIVEVEIEGIGCLKNPVQLEPSR